MRTYVLLAGTGAVGIHELFALAEVCRGRITCRLLSEDTLLFQLRDGVNVTGETLRVETEPNVFHEVAPGEGMEVSWKFHVHGARCEHPQPCQSVVGGR